MVGGELGKCDVFLKYMRILLRHNISNNKKMKLTLKQSFITIILIKVGFSSLSPF